MNQKILNAIREAWRQYRSYGGEKVTLRQFCDVADLTLSIILSGFEPLSEDAIAATELLDLVTTPEHASEVDHHMARLFVDWIESGRDPDLSSLSFDQWLGVMQHMKLADAVWVDAARRRLVPCEPLF